jgi:hypothetical protein
VSGFEAVDDPLYTWARALLPDYRDPGPGMWVRHVVWIAALAALAVTGWRQAGARAARGSGAGSDSARPPAPDRPAPTPELTSA